jgi:3-oxoacyl-[acyl-carrier protein] reductase
MEKNQKRRALVCAASGGLGFAVAKRLLMSGRSVAVASRDLGRIEAARQRLLEEAPGTAPEDVQACAADLSSAEDVGRLWSEATEGRPPIDILVTNIGGPPTGSFEEHSDETWHKQFDAIFLSIVRLMRLALPGMRERGWGRVVCVTSGSCKEPIPGLLISNALRAAVAGLVATTAREEIAKGITINNLCPGMTATDRLDDLFSARAKRSGRTVDQERGLALAQLPRGKFNSPEEFAAMAAFLASDEASGVTGKSLSVDGGAGRFIF